MITGRRAIWKIPVSRPGRTANVSGNKPFGFRPTTTAALAPATLYR